MADRSRRRTAVVSVTALAVIGGGTTAWAMVSGSGPSYRTAVAARGAVRQTLSATGTLQPVHLDAGTFQVAGTVKKVFVKQGQRVTAGQRLAVLDKSSLNATLREAQSSLASAQTRLSDAENGQLDATNVGTANNSPSRAGNATLDSAKKALAQPTPSAAPTSSAGHPQTGSGPNTSPSGNNIAADQAAIRRAQQAVDDALRRARTALDTEQSACSASPAASTTASSSPAPSPTPASANGLSCTDAAQALLADQTEVSRDEATLDQAELALTKDLAAAANAATSSGTTSRPTRSASTTSGYSGSGTTVTAADLASDQAAIDSAKAQVATARADLAQATLRSAITGKVAAVTVAKGDTVAAAADTPAVEVQGAGQDQVTIDLSASQVRQVKVGMTASVIPDGMSTASTGKVVAIQSGGTESATGSVSYPVTVTVPQRTGLVNGAAAAVTVVVSEVNDVLTVPTSAVHRNGATTYVEILSGGKQKRQNVKVGAVGPSLTAITSGITDGQRVVLADLGASVPSSSSNLDLGGGAGIRRFTFNSGSNTGGRTTITGPNGGTFTFNGPPPGAG